MEPNNNSTNPILNPTPTPTPAQNPVLNSTAVENPHADITNNTFASPTSVSSSPANPIINPGGDATKIGQDAPVNPIIQPSGEQGLAATDPIMKPEPAPAPDPVEEELKAPMKANAPVPGSIGSAVSGPTSTDNADIGVPTGNPFEKNTSEKAVNVSFNDPAAQQNKDSNTGKKKVNKNTLIALIAVVALIVIVLVVVLIMQASSGGSQANNNTTTNAEEELLIDETAEEFSGANGRLDCARAMTDEELQQNTNAESGTVRIVADFDEDGILSEVAITKNIVDAETNEMVDVLEDELLVEKDGEVDGDEYYLAKNTSGETDLSYQGILEHYQELDFACEVL